MNLQYVKSVRQMSKAEKVNNASNIGIIIKTKEPIVMIGMNPFRNGI